MRDDSNAFVFLLKFSGHCTKMLFKYTEFLLIIKNITTTKKRKKKKGEEEEKSNIS